jgi:hypothetical protein
MSQKLKQCPSPSPTQKTSLPTTLKSQIYLFTSLILVCLFSYSFIYLCFILNLFLHLFCYYSFFTFLNDRYDL